MEPDEVPSSAPETSCCTPHDDDEDDAFCHSQMWDLPEHTPCNPLHDAVEPEISPDPQSPKYLSLSAFVTPPPLAEEVEVVTQPDVSFKSLITLPVRERPTTSRQRAKPPSYDLTRDAHFSFIQERGVKNKGKKEKTTKKIRQVNQDACAICQHSYGNTQDPKATEDWLSCAVCSGWFHESCAENKGIIDDDLTSKRPRLCLLYLFVVK